MTAVPTPVAARAGVGGDWPRTGRVLPWLIAGFVVMLWLIPFDAVELPFQLPIDPKLDRFALGALFLIWLLSVVSNDPARPVLRRPVGTDYAVGAFILVCVASVLLNVEQIALADELQMALKKIALLLSMALFYVIVSTTLRPAEIRNFAILLVGLAAIAALGIVYEYRADTNVFFDWTDKLLPPGFEVASETSDPRFGRRSVTGPTSHGLAASAILAMALPFAIVGMLEARDRRRRLVYGLAAALLLAAAMSTLRKTAVLAPVTALTVLFLYRPRPMLRLLPFGVVVILAIQAAAPGALASIRDQLKPSSLQSVGTVRDRVSDYDAIKPDILAHPAVGRGYGTYDAEKYRLLDNQYLGIEISTGYLGLAAYVALWLAVMGVAGYAIRGPDRRWSGPALATSAAAAVFGMVSALFDVLAFPHVPYLLLLCAGMAAVMCRAVNDAAVIAEKPVVPLVQRLRRRPRGPASPLPLR